jgi:hypothetical protein
VSRTRNGDAPFPDAGSAVRAVAYGAGTPWTPPGETRAERRRAREAAEAAGGPPAGGWQFPAPVEGVAGIVPEPRGGHHRPDGPAAVETTLPGDWALPPAPAVPETSGDRGWPGDEARRGDPGGQRQPGSWTLPGDLSAASAADGAPPEGPGWMDRTARLEALRATGVDDMARLDGFDPGDTGTWRVRDVVPGADGGRRTTTILRYLLGLLAVDHVRALTRWAFVLPVVGLLLLLVRPRWIGLAVLVLGVLLILGRIVAVRMIAHRTLPRRYRPVEDDLRAAVEAGKANLRGELRRVGMPSSALALPRSVVRLGSSDTRSTARSRLRDIEIDRVLPRAQLDRALRVLDQASAGR